MINSQLQSNLSNSRHPWDPKNCPYYEGVHISQVHLYCNGTTTDCPYYRGVLIIEVSLL